MRASLKKPLLFLIIVAAGSVLVLFDIPLVIIFPVILLVGFGTLLALGSVTIAEIRKGIAGLGKSGILKRLNDMKFFEKKSGVPGKVPQPVPARKEVKKEAQQEPASRPGPASAISAFVASIGSLGSVIRQRSRPGKKVEDINRLLDKTVSEKVTAPPPSVKAPAIPAAAGGAGAGKAPGADDPFMSLADDEFPEGLLDGLDDDSGLMTSPPAPVEEAAFNPADFPDLETAGPDLPGPMPAAGPAGGNIPGETGAAGGGPGEFSGPEGTAGDLADEDFGDLDGLSLDDIEFDAEPGERAGTAAPPASLSPETPPAGAPADDRAAVKTAWIPSDAPKDAGETEDEVSTQADMAAFAGGSGGDDDLLSSIASDVKHTKKEQDVSLLRDLKDFRAPADEIEKELGGMYERLNQAQQTKRKNPPATKGIK